MIRTNQELYERIEEIQLLLKEADDVVYVEKLERAMYISSVVTEIFFTLQSALEDLEKTVYFKYEKIGLLVKECLDAVNSALTAAGGWSKRRS